jgi:hypothetical protein
VAIQKETEARREKEKNNRKSLVASSISSPPRNARVSTDSVVPATPQRSDAASMRNGGSSGNPPQTPIMGEEDDEEDAPENLLMDPALMLPFVLPSVTDMLVSFGAGFGGVNRERARKYIPTVPPEFLAKLEVNNGSSSRKPLFAEKDWENEEV